MFPTFISILDIQSWWEVPSIAHFCSLFRTAFNLLDFDIEDLEEALLADGTEETSWLQELIVRLLSGCLPSNEISTSNYQMFLRRLFRQKCQEHDRYNPFNTDVDFQLLPLRTKVDILHALCDFRLDAEDVLEQLKNLEADSLRVEPLGYDNNDSAYWYFYGTRLYREDFGQKSNKKKSVWQVICFTEDDWFQLNRKFKRSSAKCERQLHRTLSENFLPELPRLFREKERLARKRLLENQPRRTSRRLKKETCEKEESAVLKTVKISEELKKKRKELEAKRRATYEKSDSSDTERYEMGATKARQKKSKSRQRKVSNSSDEGSPAKNSKKKKVNEETSSSSTPTTVGRQTNNSLAAATGQIVIQAVANSTKKKLKTSQVFRQTDEDLITGMHKILDFVKNHDDAWPFADPVEEEYAPNYYTVIRKPMDLQRMEDRLDAGYYKNFDKFRDDFQLIVDNCRLYNGAENEYTEMVDNLSKVFKLATEKFLDEISSSDDEVAVEFSKSDESKVPSKRKPTLVAKTDKKREDSVSETSDVVSLEDKKKKIKPVKKTKHKKEKKADSPNRSRSLSRNSLFRSYSSSPPPSSAPSSPDNRFDYCPKKLSAPKVEEEVKSNLKSKKPQSDKIKETLLNDDTNSCDMKKTNEKTTSPTKPKDKHNKLRETIEKLKAKSEISNKMTDDDLNLDLETAKENKKKCKKDKIVKNQKKELDYDSNSTLESDNRKRKSNTKGNLKNAAIEALTLATEQTLKDINKWLDDTPKFSEFSSGSNSPSYPLHDEFDTNKPEDAKKKIPKRDGKQRRAFSRDPAKFLKRREIQRTIDRLQPGKSKGNLISNVQSKQNDDTFPALTKSKDTKNSLIVKTDDNAPKLSLGSVLDSFGRHKFVDDQPKVEEKIEEPKVEVEKPKVEEKKEMVINEETMMSSATPNLSAWFKAFGAPKVAANAPKKPDAKPEDQPKKEEPAPSPVEVVAQPIAKQRRVSTGSSVSERSSFSQDLDSPRVGIDERLGSYPVPYPSPLHRSPSGASPTPEMSPRPELSPKTNTQYPPFNGQIRVGFYQDTVSNKSSPDKNHSPRDNPQSPYPQCTEQMYAQNTAQAYTYPNSPYYGQYGNNEGYYDTTKSLTEQYQAKTQTYPTPEEPPQTKQPEKLPQNPVFPVKKRAYNETEADENLKHYQNLTEPKQTNEPVLNYSYNNAYSNDTNSYPLNIPSRPLTAPKLMNTDISKYANMGYNVQNYRNDLYTRSPSGEQQEQQHNLHYNHDMSTANHQNSNYANANEVSIPRPTYNHLEMEQPLGLRGNIANLSHIVDRYSNDYYGDKGLSSAHMFNKPLSTSSSLPMFNQNMGIQSYNQNMQGGGSIYNRQMAELQGGAMVTNEGKGVVPQQQTQEKKSKKRKTTKGAPSAGTLPSPSAAPNQGFQSYANLKSGVDSNAISLKTASVVPGSAFNFGPAAPALGIYDNPNFFDDFRAAAPNYYAMGKQAARPDASSGTRQAPPPAYPFIGGTSQPTPPPNYFMPSAQAAPLYQHYLQAGVLNQGLLAPPPGPYPPGYHAALSMRQQYESMTRAPW